MKQPTQNIALSNAQRQTLEYAAKDNAGHVSWFPDYLKGGAQQKVIEGLMRRGLIYKNESGYHVAAEGYDVLGLPRPQAPMPTDPDMALGVTQAEASWQPDEVGFVANLDKVIAFAEAGKKESKQSIVLNMLKRPEGATVEQLAEATGWQPHTVRGTLSGVIKKRLGLSLISEKLAGEKRIYRIAEA